MELIEPIADMVKKRYPDIEVKLDEPEVSIVVEVLRKNCCIGIVRKYNQRAKYNLIEFAQRLTKPKEKETADETTQKVDASKTKEIHD